MITVEMQAPAEPAELPPLAPPAAADGRWRASTVPLFRLWLVAACTLIALVVGYLDYLTGYEQSLLLFYLVPIAIATWFGGLVYGLALSALSVVVWVGSD